MKKKKTMTFDQELTEDIPEEMQEVFEVLFAAVQDAIDNPTDIIEVRMFDSETRDRLQNILDDLSIMYPEAANVELVVETIH